MEKSKIAQGQMFICHSFPLPHSNTENETQVWVKVGDEDGRSLFVDNDAMVKFSINPNYRPSIMEKWSISDEYYYRNVEMGEFVPISDLNEADRITEEKAWPAYVIDLGF